MLLVFNFILTVLKGQDDPFRKQAQRSQVRYPVMLAVEGAPLCPTLADKSCSFSFTLLTLSVYSVPTNLQGWKKVVPGPEFGPGM